MSEWAAEYLLIFLPAQISSYLFCFQSHDCLFATALRSSLSKEKVSNYPIHFLCYLSIQQEPYLVVIQRYHREQEEQAKIDQRKFDNEKIM